MSELNSPCCQSCHLAGWWAKSSHLSKDVKKKTVKHQLHLVLIIIIKMVVSPNHCPAAAAKLPAVCPGCCRWPWSGPCAAPRWCNCESRWWCRQQWAAQRRRDSSSPPGCSARWWSPVCRWQCLLPPPPGWWHSAPGPPGPWQQKREQRILNLVLWFWWVHQVRGSQKRSVLILFQNQQGPSWRWMTVQVIKSVKSSGVCSFCLRLCNFGHPGLILQGKSTLVTQETWDFFTMLSFLRQGVSGLPTATVLQVTFKSPAKVIWLCDRLTRRREEDPWLWRVGGWFRVEG